MLSPTNPEATYKTAAYCQEAYKKMKRRGVQDSALRQHIQGLNSLRENHKNMDANQAFGPEFTSQAATTVARTAIGTVTLLPCPIGVEVGTYAPEQYNDQKRVNTGRMNEDGGDDDPDDTQTAYRVAISEDSDSKRQRVAKKRGNKHRCRKCGYEYSPQKWKTCHKVERAESESLNEGQSSNEGHPQDKFLPYADNDGKKIWEICTVPDDLRCVLFRHFNYEDKILCNHIHTKAL